MEDESTPTIANAPMPVIPTESATPVTLFMMLVTAAIGNLFAQQVSNSGLLCPFSVWRSLFVTRDQVIVMIYKLLYL